MCEIPSGDLFSDDDKLPSENTSQVQEPSSLPVFSEEQISLFDTRYENGYDLCTDEDYVDWVNINHPGFLPTISDVQIPVHTEPSVSDTLVASKMTLSGSPLTDVVDSGSSTLTEPNVSDAIVIPTDTLPKNPTALLTDATDVTSDTTNTTSVMLTDITNVSEHQSTTTLTSTMTVTPTATANQPPKSSSPISEFLELSLTPRCSKKGKKSSKGVD